jgi:hypothetical protein
MRICDHDWCMALWFDYETIRIWEYEDKRMWKKWGDVNTSIGNIGLHCWIISEIMRLWEYEDMRLGGD